MRTYKIVKKGLFESNDKFEKRLDLLALEGWKAFSIATDHSTLSVLMEKEKPY
jgi:hypothetical protein